MIDDPKVVRVRDLLADSALTIPVYQRPYKWTRTHVRQLLADLVAHQHKPAAYRLGSVVFHRAPEGSSLEIVDGQQRIITLILLVRALLARPGLRADLRATLEKLSPVLRGATFPSDESKKNLRENFHELRLLVGRSDFSEKCIECLLDRCEVVTFTLSDISEAFQFFDSQNARGRDLAPHDLLKAYHLREVPDSEMPLMAEAVAAWEEKAGSAELGKLFASYLYRIRRWSRGESARDFGKDDVAVFKGVNLATTRHRHADQLRIAHHFIDDHNRSIARQIQGHAMAFPFALDQTIINGRRFFELVTHYLGQLQTVKRRLSHNPRAGEEHLSERARRILDMIDDYPGSSRKGDTYVRTLFECLLLYYMDKFGASEISAAVEKIFVWAYGLRLRLGSVYVSSIDNHALAESSPFRVLRNAVSPGDFTGFSPPMIQVKVQNEKIETLFREMGYLQP